MEQSISTSLVDRVYDALDNWKRGSSFKLSDAAKKLNMDEGHLRAIICSYTASNNVNSQFIFFEDFDMRVLMIGT